MEGCLEEGTSVEQRPTLTPLRVIRLQNGERWPRKEGIPQFLIEQLCVLDVYNMAMNEMGGKFLPPWSVILVGGGAEDKPQNNVRYCYEAK